MTNDTFRKILTISFASVILSTSTSACVAPGALIYENTIQGRQATMHKVGAKRGEACSQSYLGLVAIGDGGIAAAAKNGGIREVSTVDHHFTNVLGLYQERCVIVTGQ